jgi:hypothetical protein
MVVCWSVALPEPKSVSLHGGLLVCRSAGTQVLRGGK